MNLPENTWMVFMLGGFGGLLYCSLFRPAGKHLIKKLKGGWRQYRINRLRQAFCNGYGWAWYSVMIEGGDVTNLEACVDNPHKRTESELRFDEGATQALRDIRRYQKLHRDQHLPPPTVPHRTFP